MPPWRPIDRVEITADEQFSVSLANHGEYHPGEVRVPHIGAEGRILAAVGEKARERPRSGTARHGEATADDEPAIRQQEERSDFVVWRRCVVKPVEAAIAVKADEKATARDDDFAVGLFQTRFNFRDAGACRVEA